MLNFRFKEYKKGILIFNTVSNYPQNTPTLCGYHTVFNYVNYLKYLKADNPVDKEYYLEKLNSPVQ